ncbi:MAG TPA: tetratricopeptide repeat protein [Bacteroidales bacterium]|nr:tetratricopeptide repeat protein [Bacteroidales bacterium]
MKHASFWLILMVLVFLVNHPVTVHAQKTERIKSLCNKSELYADSIGQTAVNYADDAILLAKGLEDSCFLAEPWYCKGVALQAKSAYKEAAEYYIKAVKQAETCGNFLTATKSSNNLGVLYRITGQYKACRRWFTKAALLASENDDVQGEIQALNNLGNLAASQSKNDTAKMHYQASLNLMENHPEEATEEASVRINFAWVLYASGEKDASLEQYNKALSVLEKAPDPYAEAVCLKNMAELLMEEEKYQEAKSKLLQAEKLYHEFDNKSSLSDLYHLLYQAELALQNHKQSLAYLEKYQALQDSIDTKDMHALLADIQEKYDNERLKKEKLMQEKQLTRRQHIIMIASLLFFFLLVVLMFIIRSSRNRKRNLKIVSEKNRIIQEGLKYGRFVKTKQMQFASEMLQAYLSDWFILNMPKDEVGGDFYLFRECCEKLYVIVGDATGHGVPGGFISQRAIHLFDEEIRSEKNAGDVLQATIERWNETSARLNHFDDGFTASVLCLDKDGNADLAVSKQKLIHIKNGNKEIIKPSSFSDEIHQTKLTCQAGDCLIFTSDGYYDQLSESTGKPLKFKQFKNLPVWDKRTAQEAKSELERGFMAHKANAPQTDDVLVIGLYW